MTAAPIPALAHDHDSPSGRGGMFPLTPPVVRRSQNGFPSIRRLGFLPRSALADRRLWNMPGDHADHAGPTSALHRTPGPQIPIGPDPSPSPSQRPAVSSLGGFPTPALQPSPQLLRRAGVRNP